ncbi:MAG: carbamoyltransferase [Lentisphaeria bacterium]|nr:carbamoyltransferase [Lentisphaeria bacterium]
MNILGISSFYHDSAAALISNSAIIAAAQEERFTRIKHDSSFPANAVRFCLDFADLKTSQLDYAVFYEKPLLKLDRLVENYIAVAPRGLNSFMSALTEWAHGKTVIRKMIRKNLEGFRGEIVFPEHHESHAASAFFPSPFENAAILTLDGVGEWATASIGYGEKNKITLLKEMKYPHSLGLLYSAFTYFTGFKVNSGEYKLMGLAPYGKPVYADLIKKHLVKIFPDGSLELNMKYFNFCSGMTMTGKAFEELFGGPPRKPESPITRREMDLAASIQLVTEEIVLKMARYAREVTNAENLCMAGGVALNCSANGKIYKEKIFKNIWIQPASGDAGGALGSALFVNYHLLENKREPLKTTDRQKGSFLGNSYTSQEIRDELQKKNIPFVHYPEREKLMTFLADELAEGKVIGLFQGRMEFGPRALGGRSIIGNPMIPDMQSRINLKIKFRESFRPFAPAVLVEDMPEYFECTAESPYMLLVVPVNSQYLLPADQETLSRVNASPDLLERLNVPRSKLQAITHIDDSARVQSVDRERNPFFYELLGSFKKKNGCSVLVNTSFNIRGEPIVCSPQDALNCFYHTDMDLLVLEDCVISVKEKSASNAEEYQKMFSLD